MDMRTNEIIYFRSIIITNIANIKFGFLCMASKITEFHKLSRYPCKKSKFIALFATTYPNTPNTNIGNRKPKSKLKSLLALNSDPIIENSTPKPTIIIEKNHKILSL